jgi:hypothetical protein
LARYSLGDALTVLYDPEKPKNVIIKTHHKKVQWKSWKPPEIEKLHWRKTVNMGLLIGLIISAVFTGLQMVSPFLNLPEVVGQSITKMGCCFPTRFFIWSVIGMAAYTVMWKIWQHRQIVQEFRASAKPKAYFEPSISRMLVACPSCGRHNFPKTSQCPYCLQIVNLGQRGRALSWAAIILAVISLIFIFVEAAKVDFEVVIFCLFLLGFGINNLVLSIRENRFWHTLQ